MINRVNDAAVLRNTKNLREIRDKIKVGDKVTYYKKREIERRGSQTTIEIAVKAIVIVKYPHLVQVFIPEDKSNIVRTITYVDMLLRKSSKHKRQQI